MKYEFYIRKSNEIIGPFTAKEISEMNLPEDTSIKEFHQEEWRCLKDYKLFIMLVKLETRDRCKDDMAIKRSLNLALGEFVLNKVKVDFSASELLSEEEENAIEKFMADSKIVCQYSLEDVLGQEIEHNIAQPNFCQLSSGFVIGIFEGDKFFPRYLEEQNSTKEKICFVICDAEKKEVIVLLINPTPSSLYALGYNSNDIQDIQVCSFVEKVSCSYRYDISHILKKICFGVDSDIFYPYNTMRPIGCSNSHRYGDTYGTDSLRYNLFRAFLPKKNREEKKEHENLILAVSLMKDQQWQRTYEYAKQIMGELKQLFELTPQKEVSFSKPIDNDYWGEDAVVLIHLLYNKLLEINKSFNSNVLNDLTNSFFFWENLVKEVLKENYVCKKYSRIIDHGQVVREIVFYLPACFSNFSMKDLGMFMANRLSVPSEELENLICDWEKFSEVKTGNDDISDKPDPAFANGREKLKYYLLEGKKIYIRCDNCKVATDRPTDCNYITIPRGKFS